VHQLQGDWAFVWIFCVFGITGKLGAKWRVPLMRQFWLLCGIKSQWLACQLGPRYIQHRRAVIDGSDDGKFSPETQSHLPGAAADIQHLTALFGQHAKNLAKQRIIPNVRGSLTTRSYSSAIIS